MSIAVQQALWDYFRNNIAKNNPKKSSVQIDRMTEFFVSKPSYDILVPSLHNTGGAVDLSIIDTASNEIDMGCKFDDFTDKAWTHYFESDVNPDSTYKSIRENRRMLYNIMISVGFTNLPSEWWHYDFGDSKWAQLKHTKPVYAGILDAGLRDAVPYVSNC